MKDLGSVLEVTVASRDVERQARFCHEAFQFESVGRSNGSMLLGVPGSDRGRLRLVPAGDDPGLPPPKVWEPGLRMLGVYSTDVPKTHAMVAAAGGSPRPYHSFEVPGVGAYTEGSAHGFDDTIWVYPCPSQRLPSPALANNPTRIHSELHHVGITVTDVDAVVAFFAGAGGMAVIFDQEIDTDWACDLIGVPRGTKARLACLAGQDMAPTRLVLTAFSGMQPAATTVPERTVGIRRITFACDPDAMGEKLTRAGAIILGPGLLRGPAGVEIELRGSA